MPFHPCSLSFEPEAFCFISMHQMQPSLLYCDLASVATRVGDASRRRGIQSLWGPSTVQSTILNRALPTSAPRKFVVLLTLHRATHVEDRTHRATANEKGVDSCEMDVCRWIEQWSVYIGLASIAPYPAHDFRRDSQALLLRILTSLGSAFLSGCSPFLFRL